MSKHILLTNDDGIYSAGIRAAYRSISDLGEITVSAPSMQQSGVGRSLSIFEPLRINHAIVDGMDAYAIGGTPTDSVILGIFSIMKAFPDLILSGFNIGENISTDTITTSGTIGAALEGASYGIPAIAVSIQVKEEGLKFDELRHFQYNFDIGIKFVNKMAKKVLQKGLPDKVDLLNVNIPFHADESTDVKITRLAHKYFQTDVEKRHDPRGRPYYWITGDLLHEANKGTDVYALERGHISVTPISLDATSPISSLSQIEDLI